MLSLGVTEVVFFFNEAQLIPTYTHTHCGSFSLRFRSWSDHDILKGLYG